jgi:hypothetical protein
VGVLWQRMIAFEKLRPSGLRWEKMGEIEPAEGRELTDSQLANALTSKTQFSRKEWEEFCISDLHHDHFIKAGNAYYKPYIHHHFSITMGTHR